MTVRRTGTAPTVVLFDLDGTLSDSAPGILGALRAAFRENDVPPLDAATERALLGPPFYESLPPLIGGAEKLPAVIASYRLHYGNGGMYDTEVFAGVAEVVAAAHAKGLRLAVATSKPEPYAVPIVEHLGLARYFETVGGDELDGSLPTKALVIDKVLTRLGRPDPATVVMVGDRLHDVVGAREHGIECLAVGWGYAPAAELAAAGPAGSCATPAELAAALGLTAGAAPTA
ncbi:phosphoglycolate phosphatase [Jatrophihabitans endophyticus]|uniref:Phosphoglycolate phosphatase n=1 Tax=Jatrophihabitans endophyticus TaxID=1206085 RepID=A0A1M5DDQ9_9ACTN|nr:HAD hydrolase-like protein [Jatrophihabitans endophyticus]SHF64812.1 phosphoglycolate phosphatase [Jatrophihabitans endophyticus]